MSLPSRAILASSDLLTTIPGVVRACALEAAEERGATGDEAMLDAIEQLDAMRGSITELARTNDSGHLCLLARWIAATHAQGEPAAWVVTDAWLPVVEDLQRAGIDPSGLIWVRCPDESAALATADRLLRCGAFGLVVIEARTVRVAPSALQRLSHLAARHGTALVWRALDHGHLDASAVTLRLHARRTSRSERRRIDVCVLRARGGRQPPAPLHHPELPDGL
jgi:hypothetical protein